LFAKLNDQLRGSDLYKNFAAREKTDRIVILAILALIISSVVWLFVWQPVNSWASSSEERHLRADTLLQWMQANEKAARDAGGTGPGPSSNVGVMRLTTTTADQAGLSLTRIQPENSGGVSVVLQKQPFNDVMRWLDLLQEKEGIRIVQASIDADAVSGRVNARFSLRR